MSQLEPWQGAYNNLTTAQRAFFRNPITAAQTLLDAGVDPEKFPPHSQSDLKVLRLSASGSNQLQRDWVNFLNARQETRQIMRDIIDQRKVTQQQALYQLHVLSTDLTFLSKTELKHLSIPNQNDSHLSMLYIHQGWNLNNAVMTQPEVQMLAQLQSTPKDQLGPRLQLLLKSLLQKQIFVQQYFPAHYQDLIGHDTQTTNIPQSVLNLTAFDFSFNFPTSYGSAFKRLIQGLTQRQLQNYMPKDEIDYLAYLREQDQLTKEGSKVMNYLSRKLSFSKIFPRLLSQYNKTNDRENKNSAAFVTAQSHEQSNAQPLPTPTIGKAIPKSYEYTRVESLLKTIPYNLLTPPNNGVFTSPQHYRYVHELNIELERESQKDQYQTSTLHSIELEWTKTPYHHNSVTSSGTMFARLMVTSGSSYKPSRGDFVWVDHQSFKQPIRGFITHAHFSGITEFMCEERLESAPEPIRNYTMGLQWNDATYDRMIEALKIFELNGTSGHLNKFISSSITNAILGIDDQSSETFVHSIIDQRFLKVPALPTVKHLNDSQLAAIASFLTYTFSSVQGPPGTGKTSTASAAVSSLHYILNVQYQTRVNEFLLTRGMNPFQLKFPIGSDADALAGYTAHEMTSDSRNIEQFLKVNGLVDHAPKRSDPIFVLAPSNVAVDHLTQSLLNAGLQVIRVSAASQRLLGIAATPEVERSTLHYHIHQFLCAHPTHQLCKLHKEIFPPHLLLTGAILMKMFAWYRRSRSQGFVRSVSKEICIVPSNIVPGKKEVHITKMEEYFLSLEQLIRFVLAQADVITTTCYLAGDQTLFGHLSTQHVLIDEVSMTIEPELLIPLTRGAKHVTLFGDQQQLGPVVTCPKATQRGFRQSLFQRLVTTKTCHLSVLNTQYRMHPAISAFSSKTFYDSIVRDGVTAAQREGFISKRQSDKARTVMEYEHESPDCMFPWPNKELPIAFICSKGWESDVGQSKSNPQETDYIESLLLHFLSKGVELNKIGVITPYDAQRTHILTRLTDPEGRFVEALRQQFYQLDLADSDQDYSTKDAITRIEDQLEVCSVDAFQGREKEFIIFSCVRTEYMGFLSNPQRLNVAITRAKSGFIMIGSAWCLQRDRLWAELMNYYKSVGAYIEPKDGQELFRDTILRPLSKPVTQYRYLEKMYRKNYRSGRVKVEHGVLKSE